MKLKNTKLREGDEVIVISGREKGKRGNIKKIVGDRCVVNDLNLAREGIFVSDFFELAAFFSSGGAYTLCHY